MSKQLKEFLWFVMGAIGFFSILYVPQLRDPWIVWTILGLLGMPAFYEMVTMFRNGKKNGNGQVS